MLFILFSTSDSFCFCLNVPLKTIQRCQEQSVFPTSIDILDNTESLPETFAKKPFPPDSRNPNTGFRLFPPLIAPDFTQIPP